MRRPSPASAIATGVGFILFALLNNEMGIFPFRSGFRSRAVTITEDPSRFKLMVAGSLIFGVAALVWGLVKLTRR